MAPGYEPTQEEIIEAYKLMLFNMNQEQYDKANKVFVTLFGESITDVSSFRKFDYYIKNTLGLDIR